MKKLRRILPLFIVLTLIVGMLAACSGDTPASSAPPSQPADTGSSAPSDAPSAPGGGLSGTITYWSMWNETEPMAEVVRTAIASFEDANPDCTVAVEWKGRDVRTLVMPAIESGTPVDLFDSEPSFFYALGLDNYMELTDFFQSEALGGGQTVEESMLGGLVEWDRDSVAALGGSGMYSIPYAPYLVSWFYNKALFDEAGIDAPPTTWEEFDAACAKLVAAGIVPITTDDAYVNLIYSYYLQRAIGEDAIKTLVADKEGWDDPKVVATLEAMEDFAAKGYFSPNIDTNKYPEGQGEFALGEAAMYLNASWFPVEVADIAGEDFQWGEFAYPEVPDGVGKITENMLGSQAFCVSATTTNKEAVYELLRHVLSEATQTKCLELGQATVINSVDWPASIADQKAIVNSLSKNVDWNASIETDFTNGVVLPEIKKLITGQATAEDVLAVIMK